MVVKNFLDMIMSGVGICINGIFTHFNFFGFSLGAHWVILFVVGAIFAILKLHK